jgi:2OG-Fe(II) oxygenase superfamily
MIATPWNATSEDRLLGLAEANRGAYAAGVPYPHIVIDNFLPEAFLGRVLDEFPSPGGVTWAQHYHANSKKLALNRWEEMGEATTNLIHELNSPSVLRFLERLTGIEGLIPDVYLEGAGLHLIERGGFLRVHADFNIHQRWRLDRRLNLLVYLNRDWKEEYGGAFELWDRDMTRCIKKVLPVFNRCVIFGTTDYSYHGHPDPLTCPEGMSRKSLALYYYSNGRPAEEVSEDHGTLYQARPNGSLAEKFAKAKRVARRLLPPIVYDLLGRN